MKATTHWSFQYGGTHYSKTPPKRSQLTQSSFLQEVYSLQEDIPEMTADDVEGLEAIREDIILRAEELRDQCQDSFDNIPEQLQEYGAGSTLQERIDALDNYISELESIDLDDMDEKEDDETDEEFEARKEDWVNDKLSEIASIEMEI